MKKQVRLGVNIDHVATLRQARGTLYPDPVHAAFIAINAGADGITLHLREDRRHIQERDLQLLKQTLTVPMNLEMAATLAMCEIAEKYKPECVCLVPEKREELTTEGGLDVISQEKHIHDVCRRLGEIGIQVSLFIDAEKTQIDAALRCKAPVIELHTGAYAEAKSSTAQEHLLKQIQQAATYAHNNGLIVNAGHGLHYHNVQAIAAIAEIHELNIGHAIVARAVLDGFHAAVAEMKKAIES